MHIRVSLQAQRGRRGTLLTTSSDSSSGGMWVMVPQVRVSITVLCISRDSPKSATLATAHPHQHGSLMKSQLLYVAGH